MAEKLVELPTNSCLEEINGRTFLIRKPWNMMRAVSAPQQKNLKRKRKYVATAIFPLYEDLSNIKLLERCVGGFTQNNNESYNQLVWKITPKIIPAGSKIVEIAANIAAGVFNEGKTSLLYYMSAMGLSLGPNAHSYVSKEDAERISISDARAQGSTREGRMARRQQQLNVLEANDEAEGSSYGAGIDDTM